LYRDIIFLINQSNLQHLILTPLLQLTRHKKNAWLNLILPAEFLSSKI
jgi:hypothetical protein